MLALCSACGSPESRPWALVAHHLPAALLSVWGTSDHDVYAVGGDLGDGSGPEVVHWDGSAWNHLATGQTGDLWWVFGFANGPIYMGGAGGMILRYESGVFTRMTTPGINTVFGMWGSSPTDMWAVGGAVGGANGAFAWRLQGDTWVDNHLLPATFSSTDVIWKMYGRSANDAWMVATNGNALRWDGTTVTLVPTGAHESLFTVHADADRYVAVGGFGTGIVLENTGAGWTNASPAVASPGLVGVRLSPEGDFAVGQEGAVYSRAGGDWNEVPTGQSLDESFHSVWIDDKGGVWAVGGQVLTLPLVDGTVMYGGASAPGELQ